MHTYKIVEHDWKQNNRYTVFIDGVRALEAVNEIAAKAFVAGRIYFEQAGCEPNDLIHAYIHAWNTPELQALKYDRLNSAFNQNFNFNNNLPDIPIGFEVSAEVVKFYANKQKREKLIQL